MGISVLFVGFLKVNVLHVHVHLYKLQHLYFCVVWGFPQIHVQHENFCVVWGFPKVHVQHWYFCVCAWVFFLGGGGGGGCFQLHVQHGYFCVVWGFFLSYMYIFVLIFSVIWGGGGGFLRYMYVFVFLCFFRVPKVHVQICISVFLTDRR